MTGLVLHTLDPHRPNAPNPPLRLHCVAGLQEPDDHGPNPYRRSRRRVHHCFLPRLRPVTPRTPPPIPAVHLHHRRHLAPRRHRCRRTVPALPSPADVVL